MILLYHRITELECDPQLLSVSSQHFEDHLQIITQFYRPQHLANITQHLSLGHTIPRRSVIITFDDGYADNLHHAKPLLEQYRIPATVFVSPGELHCSKRILVGCIGIYLVVSPSSSGTPGLNDSRLYEFLVSWQSSPIHTSQLSTLPRLACSKARHANAAPSTLPIFMLDFFAVFQLTNAQHT